MKLEHDRMCREAHEKLDQWLAGKEAEKLKLKMVSCLKYKQELKNIINSWYYCCRRKK